MVEAGGLREAGILLDLQKESWEWMARSLHGLSSPAVDTGGEGGSDGRSRGRGWPGFGGCPAARDLEEPLQLAIGVEGSLRSYSLIRDPLP